CATGGALVWRATAAQGVIAALASAALAAWCAALGVVDLRAMRLPNRLTVPGAGVIVAAATLVGVRRGALLGAGLLTAFYLAAHLARPAAMGAGDRKLAAGLGAATALGGGRTWVLAAVGALLLTAAGGTLARAARSRGGAWPHGPAMCLASLAALV